MSWKIACLAGLLLSACDFGSQGGSGNGPGDARLWHLPLSPDTGAAWASDSVGMVVDGDSLKQYRLWNGCYRPIGASKATEFLKSTTFAAEVVAGPGGDSLRMSFTRDSLHSVLLGEIRGACLDEAPIGQVAIRTSDLDGGAFGYADTLHVILDYAFTPQAGDAREYRVMLDFYSSPRDFRARGESQILNASEGTARLAIPAGKLPTDWAQGKPVGYIVNLAFARNANRTDFIAAGAYRPILATFRQGP